MAECQHKYRKVAKNLGTTHYQCGKCGKNWLLKWYYRAEPS